MITPGWAPARHLWDGQVTIPLRMRPTGRSLVVGLLSEEQEFQRMQAADAVRAAREAGFGVQVLYAEGNAVLQIQQLYRVIHLPEAQRPHAIVVETVVGEGLERVARAATAAGIGWVLLNHHVPYLAPLRRDHPAVPVFSVSTDQEEAGRIQARQLLRLVPGRQGTVLYLQGPADTAPARLRLQGAREALAGTAIELRVLGALWTEASGEDAVKGWLRLKTSEGSRPEAVASQNDAMAVGARRAWDTSGRPDLAGVPFTGCDGLTDGGQQLVRSGRLAATIVVPSNTGVAISALAKAGAGVPPPPEILLKPVSYPPEAQIAAPSAHPARP